MIKLFSDGVNNSLVRFILLFLLINMPGIPDGSGQVTPFGKSVLDSLQANDFNLSLAFAFNSSQDGSNTLATGMPLR
jgi:hypothetical protein